LRSFLEAAPHLCTREELEAYWPGGAENQLPPEGRWIYCLMQYAAFWRRSERGAVTEADLDAAGCAALDAFREKPIVVELVERDNGTPRTVSVYPKSFDTLSLIDEIHGNILWALAKIMELENHWTAENEMRRQEYHREVTELHLTQCWILTHPGCEAPFNPSSDLPPLPDTFRSWYELDILNVLKAHHTLHQERIGLICRALRGQGSPSGRPASWETLATAAAKGQGTVVEHLLRRRSFGAWLAQAAVTWQAEADAAAAAGVKRPATSGLPAMEL
jgi:hypothetical protein